MDGGIVTERETLKEHKEHNEAKGVSAALYKRDMMLKDEARFYGEVLSVPKPAKHTVTPVIPDSKEIKRASTITTAAVSSSPAAPVSSSLSSASS